MWMRRGVLFAPPSGAARPLHAQDAPSAPAAAPAVDQPSPWLLLPIVSSNPKLGTAVGGFGGYAITFDPGGRVSLFGATYQYTSTHSTIGAAFARPSFGAAPHRIAAVVAFGYVKNNYDDYLGTGEPLKTNDDLKAVIGRYLFRVKGPWFLGAQGNAANYQVLGESPEDQLT